MEKNGNELTLVQSRNPITSFFLVLVFSFIGFAALGPFVGLLFALPFEGFDLNNVMDILQNPVAYPDSKVPLLVVQGISSVVGFVLLPSLFLIGIKKTQYSIFFKSRVINPTTLFITVAFVISFMVINSVFVEWNANLHLPEFMQGFEEWARGLEDNAQVLTEFLTSFNNAGQFILGLFVIAIIPAIGEEFVFRGLLQNYSRGIFKNPNIAIWFTAILFSTFHLQFFGFVPRMLLGAAFGYLYFWSGNLLIPIIAHFINNGFTLTMIYLYKLNKVEFNIESSDSPSLITVIPFALITVGLLYYFYNYTKKLREENGNLAESV